MVRKIKGNRSNGQDLAYICYSRNGIRAAGSVILDVLDYSDSRIVELFAAGRLEKFFDVNQYSCAIFDISCVSVRAHACVYENLMCSIL